MRKQTGSILLIVVIAGVVLSGCSVQPVSIVPAETLPVDTLPVNKVPPASPSSTDKAPSYTPSARSNTAYPSSAARQLIVKAEEQFSEGNEGSALRSLERAQRISPRAPEIYLEMARVRLHLGQTGQARQLANKALSLVGGDDHLRYKTESFLSNL